VRWTGASQNTLKSVGGVDRFPVFEPQHTTVPSILMPQLFENAHATFPCAHREQSLGALRTVTNRIAELDGFDGSIPSRYQRRH
jgi:hypothetical protein